LTFKQSEKYPDWLYLLFLVAPIVFLYFRVLIGKTFFWDDALFLWYPYRHLAASSLSKGVFPLWNPFLTGGTVFQADVQSSTLYPFNLLLTPFIYKGMLSSRALQLITIIHVYLGGIFMFLFTKKLLNHKFSAFFCSLIYVMLPQLVYRSVQPVVLESMIWLPLLFLIVLHLIEKKNWLFTVFGGIVIALNLYTGFPHFALMGFSLVSLYILSHVIKEVFIKKNIKNSFYLILQSITMFIIGVGLFAIQLLPSIEFTEIATRAVGWNYNLATDVSFHPLRFINILIPKFFGNPSPLVNDSWIKMPYYSTWEMAIYLGILPLVFAVNALLRDRNFKIGFFAIAALLSILFALGKYGFAYYLVYLTPVFHKFRCPARFIYIFNFSMIILAGYGIKNMLTNPVEKRVTKKILILLLVFAFFILLFVAGLFREAFDSYRSFNIAREYSFISLIVILSTALIFFHFEKLKNLKCMPIVLSLFVFVDLFLACFGVFEGSIKPEDYFIRSEPVSFFARQGSEYYRTNLRIKNLGLVFPRNIGCVHKFYTLQGLMPLKLMDFNIMSETLNQNVRFDLYNVKYTLAENEGKIFLLERENYLPRVKFYYNYLVAKDKNEVFELLNNGNFNYREKIILDEKPFPDRKDVTEVKDSVQITEYNENSILLKTNSTRKAILFLSEHFYPGWKAYIDGREEKIIKAFVAFKAVPVPEGSHKVNFVFKPDSFIRGRNISIATLLFTIILFVFSLTNYKKKP